MKSTTTYGMTNVSIEKEIHSGVTSYMVYADTERWGNHEIMAQFATEDEAITWCIENGVSMKELNVETMSAGIVKHMMITCIRKKNGEEYRNAFGKGTKAGWSNYRRQMRKFIKSMNIYADRWNKANLKPIFMTRAYIYGIDTFSDEDVDYMLDYGLWC